ncbi:MAG: hypothetical protein UH850_13675 [Paludibacteraceae bacterium]|nr:hypothetical protein [Paludibacteraceae bacterium]
MEYVVDLLIYTVVLGVICGVFVLLTNFLNRWNLSQIEDEYVEECVNNDDKYLMSSPPLNLNNVEFYTGKVKKITRYYMDIDGENVTKAEICSVVTYNENQKAKDLFRFNHKGKKIKQLIYEYDEKENLIFEKELKKNGKLIVNEQHFYNEKGELIETKYWDDGGISFDSCFKYDENGNCIEVNTDDYRLDGIVVKTRNVSLFDENNREIERIKYEGLTGETEKEVYFYYDNGKMKETQIVDIETGKINSHDLYQYALDGKLSEIVTYEGSEVTERWIYTYENGKETECRIYDGLGNLTYKHVSLYDERGSFCGTKKYKNGILIFSYLDEIEYYD